MLTQQCSKVQTEGRGGSMESFKGCLVGQEGTLKEENRQQDRKVSNVLGLQHVDLLWGAAKHLC
eukprot:1144380-Pelagomonas_calceolata.AAC.7